MMAKEPKIPLRIQRIVRHLEGGQTLCMTMPPDGGERRYFLEPSQRNVARKSAEEAISLGLLEPHNDGLFGSSQTWGARHG